MKKILTFLSICFWVTASSAQTADIEVSYNMHSFYANGVEKNNKYHLLANSTRSKFFNPRSEEIDSLTSTPEGLAGFKKTQEAALKAMIGQGQITVDKLPRKKVTDYVVKSAQDSLRAWRALIDNPMGTLTARGLLEGVILDSKQLTPESNGIDFIETDYR